MTLCRPFVDLNKFESSATLNFYSDASGKIGFRAVFSKKWMFGLWNESFLKDNPSIEYQELFALCAAIFSWEELIANTRVIIFCDNQAVVSMINNTTSGCHRCMVLIRLLVLNNLKFNRRVFIRYVTSKNNGLSDALSRNQLDRFKRFAAHLDMEEFLTKINAEIWPVDKVWHRKF